MKVVLLTDVPKIGNKYDIKNLKDGFAQNVLIARGLATLATPQLISRIEKKKELMQKKKKEETENFSEVLGDLNNKKITIKAKTNDKGHLFKAIKEKDIATAVNNSLNIDVNENDLVFDHIKEVGEHKIIFQKGELKGEFTVEVVGE